MTLLDFIEKVTESHSTSVARRTLIMGDVKLNGADCSECFSTELHIGDKVEINGRQYTYTEDS